MPRTIYMYVCDYDRGLPIYAAAETIADIPEQEDGAIVGTYSLTETATFQITRTLKHEVSA